MQPPRPCTLIFLMIFLAGCGSLWGTPGPAAYAPTVMVVAPPGSIETATPFQPLGVTLLATPTLPSSATTPLKTASVPQPTASSLWISPAVPDALRQSALASGLSFASAPENATVLFDINLQSSIENRQSVWIYTLVAPFPTVTDGVSADELRRAWAGE
ncbi:MAG: hypothetical protein Q8N45_06755, partial [Anaerolineales bacterium]|nr:hypothetical protein [Anaerolineales bacterium]